MKTKLQSFNIIVISLLSTFFFHSSYSQNFSEWVAASNPGNWSNNANWTNGTSYGQLEFKGNGSITSNNDLGTINQWRLYFNGSQGYNITGNRVELFDNSTDPSWILSDSSENQNISLEVCFCDSGSRPAWITARGSGGFSFQDNIDIAGNVTNLSIGRTTSGTQITVNGIISGNNKDVYIGRDNNFNLSPDTSVAFRNANTYSGNTFIDAGTLSLFSNASSNGSLANSNVFISLGTSLIISNNTTSTVLSIQERGSSNGGRIRISTGATLNINDPAGPTRFQNRIDGSGDLNKNGPGTLSLYGTQNFFTGNITVNDGIFATSSQLGASSITINNSGRFDAITATNTIPQASTVTVNTGGELRFFADQTLDDLEVSGTLFIDSGVTLTIENTFTTSTANIQGGGTLIINGIWTNTTGTTTIASGTNTILTSDASGSAQFDQPTAGSISGDVTVERYIPAERAFRLLASPVTTSGSIFDNWQEGGIYPTPENNIGTHITGVQGTVGQFDAATGLDQTASGNPSMFTFDNTFIPSGAQTINDAWNEVTSTNQTGDILNAEMPYLLFVRGDRSIDLSSNSSSPTDTTLSATGTLFTNSTSTQTLSNQPEYFSLVANPFQAIVDFNALAFTGLGNANFMYVYDPTQKDYVTLDATVPADVPDMFIRPGQSVFVVNNTGSVTTSTVEIEQVDINTSPTPGPSTTVFNDNQIANLELKLYNDTNDLRENLRIRFEDNASNAIDSFDAPKLMGTSENLASINSGNIYTIERRASVQDTDNVPLHLDQYQGYNYEFRLNLDNWNSNIEILVEDNYLNTTTQIDPNQPYAFSVDTNIPESIAENRFSLVFDNTTLGVDDNTFGANFKLYPNPSPNGQFHIKTPNLSGEINVEISNLLGQQVSVQKLSIEEQQVNVNAENLSSGIYLVKLSQDNQSFSTKLMVE